MIGLENILPKIYCLEQKFSLHFFLNTGVTTIVNNNNHVILFNIQNIALHYSA